MNVFYDIEQSDIRHNITNQAQIITATNVEYDLDNDGLYSVLFKYKGGYFTLCRNLYEDDEQIYIERDNQNNAACVSLKKMNYILQGNKIEFVIDKEVKFDIDFPKTHIIDISLIDSKQYHCIEKVLKHIFAL